MHERGEHVNQLPLKCTQNTGTAQSGPRNLSWPTNKWPLITRLLPKEHENLLWVDVWSNNPAQKIKAGCDNQENTSLMFYGFLGKLKVHWSPISFLKFFFFMKDRIDFQFDLLDWIFSIFSKIYGLNGKVSE